MALQYKEKNGIILQQILNKSAYNLTCLKEGSMSTFMRCGLQLITLLPFTLSEMQAAKVT